MKIIDHNNVVALDIKTSIWEQIFTVAPLVVIGSKEKTGYDLAPKHMATPIGFGNYFGFVCTPKHSTYNNIKKNQEFTVSFPLPNHIIFTSLSATSRQLEISKSKQIIDVLPTFKAPNIDALFIKNSYLYLECTLFKIIDGFDENSIITGKITSAFANNNYLKYFEEDEQGQIKNNPLLVYIAPGRFAKITETYNFPFPKNFKR